MNHRRASWKTWLIALGTALTLGSLASNGQAAGNAQADFPNKPIKIIATYQPGGTNDIMARLAADIWSKAFNVPVVVENRTGSSGNLGTGLVAKAKPDGYTLLAGTFGPITTSPTLYPDLPYDPLKDFAPVGRLATVPNVIFVNPSLPANSLGELIALSKRRAEPLKFGIVYGGTPQFLVAKLQRTTHLNLLEIPYKGGTSALNDLIGNHLDLYIDNLPLVLPQIRGGTVKALAVASQQRSPQLPDVPTTAEAGYPDVEVSAWHGILAPAGTPPQVIEKLNQTLVAALHTPEVRERIERQGGTVIADSPEQFAAFIRSEVPRWASVIHQNNITANE
ncbi:Bug family tripartite tricarboxylate transporter substrate binding protein [Pseudomonas typographi]|uniref:Bug family tripartite tricarboxylate transporter substrate binding protein n=1 Tax=Pseudomonas typographi TaxID=2715964 RepID=UPI001681F962|nr:tripartite tricarboxylate transporter substrate binding protein [Pseudomonas typographi]MBD1552051.1 tripartite tricarboxylate transporter substrate binding protein [Pseudomonas typographi]